MTKQQAEKIGWVFEDIDKDLEGHVHVTHPKSKLQFMGPEKFVLWQLETFF